MRGLQKGSKGESAVEIKKEAWKPGGLLCGFWSYNWLRT